MRTLTLAAIVAGFEVVGATYVAACSVSGDGTRAAPGDASSSDVTIDSPASDGATEGSPDVVSHEVVVEAAEDATEAAVDAGSDVAACTPASCPGACCGNRCVLEQTCGGCSAGALFCPFSTTVVNSNGQCVASCSTCAAEAIDLKVACMSSGSPASGTCVASASDCPTSAATDAGPCSSGDGSCDM